MDSSKIISLEDFIRKENRFPAEEEALQWAIQLCDLLPDSDGAYRMLTPKNIYIENEDHWSTAHPPITRDPAEALFRLGSVLHYLVTRNPFKISHYLDGPPPVREKNPQISVRFESILSKLLQNVRSMRYSDPAELREDLLRLQKELTGDWTVHWSSFKGNGTRTNSVADSSFQPAGKTLKQIWKADIGEIWASAVHAGEYVFIGSGNGSFYSLDAQTGKIIWQLSLGARVESTPYVVDGIAYLGNDLGNFYAINIKNGSLLWKRSLGEYIRSSPYGDQTNVFVGSIHPAQKTGILWCLSRADGSVLWKRNMGQIFSSPVVDRGEVIIGSDDEKLYCFSTSGAERWRVGLSGKIRCTAAAVRDFLYVGGFGGVLYKIRRSGEIVWRNQDAGSMYSSPASGRGFLTVGNNAGMLNFFQGGTGKKVGEFATRGPITASPLIVNQYVLIGSNDGIFYILDSKANSVCSFDANAPINSSACYHDNTIYIGTDHGLYALSF